MRELLAPDGIKIVKIGDWPILADSIIVEGITDPADSRQQHFATAHARRN